MNKVVEWRTKGENVALKRGNISSSFLFYFFLEIEFRKRWRCIIWSCIFRLKLILITSMEIISKKKIE